MSTANLSHDYGSLNAAIEVSITELDAKLALLKLRNEQRKIQAKILYFLPHQDTNLKPADGSSPAKQQAHERSISLKSSLSAASPVIASGARP